jgi:hypothetical protein
MNEQQYLKRFAIIMDNEDKSRNKSYFTRLIDSLSEKLSSKKRPTIESKIQVLLRNCEFSHRDTIYVDEDLNFEQSLFRSDSLYFNNKKKANNNNKYFLMRDFDKLIKLLSEYCDEPCSCKRHKDNEYEVEVTVEVPKRKKLRKVTTYDKITILERWVKIGYEMYRRQFDWKTGDEYIVVDGDVYEIRRDRYGKEYLA